MPRIRKHAARDQEHRAIGNLLDQIELDTLEGKRIQALPEDLARAMLVNLGHTGNFDEEIEGDVAI